MTRYLRNIIRIAAALSIAMLHAACSDKNELPEEFVEKGSVQVSFSLPTRAGESDAEGTQWKDSYNSNQGIAYDSYLATDKIHLAIYDGESYVGEIEKVFFYLSDSGDEGSTSTEYTYLGKLPAGLKADKDYRIMVFANAFGYDNAKNYTAAASNFTIGQIQPSREDAAIPMWGVATGKFKTGVRTEFTEPLPLLRSVGKTYIKLSDAARSNGFSLSEATLTLPTGQGYIVPDGWKEAANTTDIFFREDENEVYSPASNPIAGGSEQSQVFTKVNDNLWVVYAPECKNTNGDAKISFSIEKDGKDYTIEGKSFELSYRDYAADADNAYFDIARNHIYRFEIDIKETVAQTIDVSVKVDWDDTIELKPSYGGGNDYGYNK